MVASTPEMLALAAVDHNRGTGQEPWVAIPSATGSSSVEGWSRSGSGRSW
jgi:hypothetical protein